MARYQDSHGHPAMSTSPENSRHFSRKGLNDNRGLLKKGGAGSHNWGNFKDELEEGARDERTFEDHQEKVRVIDSAEFSKLHA